MQQRIHRALEEISGAAARAGRAGHRRLLGAQLGDAAVKVLARTFARLVTGEGLRRDAARGARRASCRRAGSTPSSSRGKRPRRHGRHARASRAGVHEDGRRGRLLRRLPRARARLCAQDRRRRQARGAGAAMALVERLYPAARGLMPLRADQDLARRGGRRHPLRGGVRGRARRSLKV